MKRRYVYLFIGICCLTVTMMAQNKPVLLFPQGAPGQSTRLVEKESSDGAKVGGQKVLRMTDVSEPAITIYPAPDEVATGAAVVVCPGGGYGILAYDLEGTEICEWLNNLGVTAVLLKYRVPRKEGVPKHEVPLQDLQRAMSYVRASAEELNIDPQRIGVMGFSAGGHLAVMLSNNYNDRTYPSMDDKDKVSSRPDFCLLVYPAYLSGDNFQLAPDVKVSTKTPPTMIIQSEDDKPFINSALFYYYALKEAGVPARMHLYSDGGHGYGLRDTGASANEWPDRVEDWFHEISVIE